MVIECIGLPGSGKTHLMNMLERELRRRDVEYVNVSGQCMHNFFWKAGRKGARSLIYLDGGARKYRDQLRGILGREAEKKSSFGIYDGPEYAIKSAVLLDYLYRKMTESHKIYLFDEGLVHTFVKYCADARISGEVFEKLIRAAEKRLGPSRLVVYNECGVEECMRSILKRDRHTCEFDELESGRKEELLREYERLNEAYRRNRRVLAVNREEDGRVRTARVIGGIKRLYRRAGRKAAE